MEWFRKANMTFFRWIESFMNLEGSKKRKAKPASIERIKGRITLKDLAKKVVVITGGGSGIGRMLVKLFVQEGSQVVALDNHPGRLAEVKEEIEKSGGSIEIRPVDVTDYEAMESLANDLIETKGGVDVLVNNAGVGHGGPIKDIKIEDWRWVVNTNLMGPINGIKVFLPHMIERRSGHIMNISSANGLFPLPYTSPYASTKFALRALSEILQYEVAQYGVGVTTVHPGMIKDTHLLDHGRPDNEDGPKIQRIADRVGYDLEKAGKAMVKAVRANKARLRVPWTGSGIYQWLYESFPNLWRWVMVFTANRITAMGAGKGTNN
jgi:NAD(P)-dependent dehydrogenase (short-subunit alcohol dehydrogenase family)